MPSSASPVKEKKHKKHGDEKKRKRDHDGEETHKHKTKKHRADKHKEHAQPEAAEVEMVDATPAIEEIASESPQRSPFHVQTSSLYLPLAPISQRTPIEGICAEHLSPLLLTYYPPFHGVVLAYNNPRLSEKPFGDDGKYTLMQCTDEYAVSWSWVTAEFMLFKPQRGTELDGYINLQNEGHLGVVCWNLFNASIPRDRLPRDWKWIGTEDMDGQGYAEEGAGYYVDGEGNKIEGMIKFRVKDIETSHDKERGFLSIEGTMLEESEEKGLLAKEAAKLSKDRGSIGRRLGGARALGATSLTAGVEPASQEETETRRHRLNY